MKRVGLTIVAATLLLALLSPVPAVAAWDITVSDAPTSNIDVTGGQIPQAPDGWLLTANGPGANINATELSHYADDGNVIHNGSHLTGGRVVVETGDTGTEDGSITVISAVTMTSGTPNLSFDVAGDIILEAPIGSFSSSGFVTLKTGSRTVRAEGGISFEYCQIYADIVLTGDFALSCPFLFADGNIDGPYELDLQASATLGSHIQTFWGNFGATTPLAGLKSRYVRSEFFGSIRTTGSINLDYARIVGDITSLTSDIDVVLNTTNAATTKLSAPNGTARVHDSTITKPLDTTGSGTTVLENTSISPNTKWSPSANVEFRGTSTLQRMTPPLEFPSGGAITLASGSSTTIHDTTTFGSRLDGAADAVLAIDSGAALQLDAPGGMFAGTLRIDNGTLRQGVAEAIPAPSEVLVANTADATLDLAGRAATVRSLRSASSSPNSGKVINGDGLRIGGAAPTSFWGALMNAGPLTKRGAASWQTVAPVNASSISVEAGELIATAGIPDPAPSPRAAITLADAAGAKLTLGAASWSGPLSGGNASGTGLGVTGRLVVDQRGATTTLSAPITGTGTLELSSSAPGGELTLAGTSTLVGVTSLASGTLRVLGSMNTSAVELSGGTLRGSGSIGGIAQVSGTAAIAPDGILASDDLRLTSGSILRLDIDSPIAGSGFDQMAIFGSVEPGGAKLDIDAGYSPAANASLVIITNAGRDEVSGTFAGLVEGAEVLVGSTSMRITYSGGDGNDVELYVPKAPVVNPDPTPPGPTLPVTTPPADRTKPSVVLVKPATTVTRAAMLKGLVTRFRISEPSTVTQSLRISPKLAKKWGFAKQAPKSPLVLGTGKVRVTASGQSSVKVVLTRAAKTRIGKLRAGVTIPLTVVTVALDSDGNITTNTRVVTLAIPKARR